MNGPAPSIGDLLRAWRAHVVARLAHEADRAADPVLVALLEELKSYPVPPNARPYRPVPAASAAIAVPLRLITGAGTLAFISTTTVFGTAVDVTVAEITIESFFPADAETADVLRRLRARDDG